MFSSETRVVDDAGVDIETGKYVGDAIAYQEESSDPKQEYIDKITGKGDGTD